MAPRNKAPMSNAHKAALAAGRDEGRKVRVYLEALEAQRPKRGRKRTPESIERRLAQVAAELPEAAPLRRLALAQEQVDLLNEHETLAAGVDHTQVEAAFIEVAKSYADRKGIGYTAWRDVGVPAAVLKQAGITRGS